MSDGRPSADDLLSARLGPVFQGVMNLHLAYRDRDSGPAALSSMLGAFDGGPDQSWDRVDAGALESIAAAVEHQRREWLPALAAPTPRMAAVVLHAAALDETGAMCRAALLDELEHDDQDADLVDWVKQDAETLATLTKGVRSWVRELADLLVERHPDTVGATDADPSGAMLIVDATAIEWFDSKAPAIAGIIRDKSTATWAEWHAQVQIPGVERPASDLWAPLWGWTKVSPPWLGLLVEAYWDKVGRRLATDARDRDGRVPVLELPVLQLIHDAALSPSRTARPISVVTDHGRRRALIYGDIECDPVAEIVALDGDVIEDVAARLAETCQAGFVRTLMLVANTAGGQLARGAPDPCSIVVEGGKREFTKIVGCHHSEADEILKWGRRLTITTNDRQIHGLWQHSFAHGGGRGGGNRHILTIQANSQIFRQPRENFVPLPHLAPPRASRSPRTRGAEWVYYLSTFIGLRERADSYLEHGGFHLPAEWWERIAKRCGVSPKTLRGLRSAYLTGDDDGPAVFAAAGGRDLYDLAPAYAKQRAKLIEGGARTARNRDAGRKRAREAARKDGRYIARNGKGDPPKQ